jgi:hypothetical protein
MSEFEIDFEWQVADRYELRPAIKKVIGDDLEPESAVQRELLLMMEARRLKKAEAAEREDPVEYWLFRSGGVARIGKIKSEKHWLYGIPESELPVYLGDVAVAGKLKQYRIKSETLEKAVKLLVAGLDKGRKTPFYRIALRVSQAIGAQSWKTGDAVGGWHSIAERLRFLFEGRVWEGRSHQEGLRWPAPETQQVGELGILLVPDKKNKAVLALRPNSLHSALVFTAARMKATGTTFNICEHCKSPFLSGGVRFRAKRGDAKFCSDECRWRWHNESRRKAR